MNDLALAIQARPLAAGLCALLLPIALVLGLQGALDWWRVRGIPKAGSR